MSKALIASPDVSFSKGIASLESRIDVIKWSDNLKQFIVDALVPAEIDHINLDTENNIADVFIEEGDYDEQNLALAIGKRGQNVRLASQLTQFELNIRMLEDTKSESKESDDDVPEIQLFSDLQKFNFLNYM